MTEHEKWNTASWRRSSHMNFWKNMNSNRHVLQVYDNDHVLMVALNGFARTAIACHEPMIVVATSGHLGALSRSLRLFGQDPDQLRLDRMLLFADAGETLGRFMRNGMPDEDLFHDTLGELVAATRGAGRGADGERPVKIYGEMVALLWEQGMHEATFALEAMWTKACEERNLHLFCGYPRSLFLDSQHGKLLHICQHHACMVSGSASAFTEVKYRAM
jgi:hypothetical protein